MFGKRNTKDQGRPERDHSKDYDGGEGADYWEEVSEDVENDRKADKVKRDRNGGR